MTVTYGQPITRDPRRYDQSTLKPGEAQQISNLLKVDTNQIRTRGFHPSYLLLLSIALGEQAELELGRNENKKRKSHNE